MDEESVKNLVSKIECARCGQHYEPVNTDILAHMEDLWIFSVYCDSCKIRSLLATVVKENRVQEVVTELSEVEQTKFLTTISSDDLLDMHVFLKDFSGDFSSLFCEK